MSMSWCIKFEQLICLRAIAKLPNGGHPNIVKLYDVMEPVDRNKFQHLGIVFEKSGLDLTRTVHDTFFSFH